MILQHAILHYTLLQCLESHSVLLVCELFCSMLCCCLLLFSVLFYCTVFGIENATVWYVLSFCTMLYDIILGRVV